MPKQTTLDIQTFTIDAVDNLPFLDKAELTLEHELQDGSSIVTIGETNCITKRSAKFSCGLFSNSSETCKVSNLDVTAVSLGGTDILAIAPEGTIRGTVVSKEASGPGDLWKYPEALDMNLSGNVKLLLPNGSNFFFGAGGLAKSLFVDDKTLLSNLDISLSVTINSAVVTIPCTISSVGQSFDRGDFIQLDVELASRSVYGADYPTSPTGTTSLLEKFCNSFRTTRAIVLDTGGTGFGVYTGNFLFESMEFGWNQSSLIVNEFNFMSHGPLVDSSV